MNFNFISDHSKAFVFIHIHTTTCSHCHEH